MKFLFLLALASVMGCTTLDAVSSATATRSEAVITDQKLHSGVLIILASSKTNNTVKIAQVLAAELNAQILSPEQAESEDLSVFRLIGFGSGILNQRHHESLLAFARNFPPDSGKKTFIFSTSGFSRQFALDHGTEDTHTPLRNVLLSKGFDITGEFNCEGFNQNSFLVLFGGMNKGRPNEQDLQNAAAFARGLKY